MLETQTMNLDFIRTFVVSGQSKTMKEASQKLNLDVTNVKRHIVQLEDKMGCKLVKINNGQIELTQDGKEIFEGFEKAYNTILFTEKNYKQKVSINTGKISIGKLNDIDNELINPQIRSFREKYPNISFKIVNLTSEELYEQLSQLSLDFVIDEERNLIVLPINKNCYFARSTVNNNKIKSRGSSDIWNKEYIINQEKLIYVTESIIDSLSLEVIDSNVKTISINGIGNINSLVNTIKKYNYDGNIVIVFDNDRPGIEASHKLKEELTKIGVNSFSVTMISNFDNNCKDLNQALQDNRKLLEDNYNYFNDSFKKIIDYKGDELKIG